MISQLLLTASFLLQHSALSFVIGSHNLAVPSTAQKQAVESVLAVENIIAHTKL